MFVNAGTLFAAPFDLGSLELTASPVPVLQELAVSLGEGGAQFDFSENGLLAYIAGSSQVDELSHRLGGPPGRHELSSCPSRASTPAPSSRRTRSRSRSPCMRGDNWDVWVYDLERGVSTRLTFDKSIESEQIWSPDGQWLILSSDQEGPDSLYRKRADGSGELERLTEAKSPQWAATWSSDGRYVAYITQGQQFDLGYLDLETRETHTFLATEFGEGFPDFSPDGRWLAYGSNESGGGQAIYVRPFPSGEGKVAGLGRWAPVTRAGARTAGSSSGAPTRASWSLTSRPPAARSGPARCASSSRGRSRAERREFRSVGLQFDDYDVSGRRPALRDVPRRAEGRARRPRPRHPGDGLVRRPRAGDQDFEVSTT